MLPNRVTRLPLVSHSSAEGRASMFAAPDVVVAEPMPVPGRPGSHETGTGQCTRRYMSCSFSKHTSAYARRI